MRKFLEPLQTILIIVLVIAFSISFIYMKCFENELYNVKCELNSVNQELQEHKVLEFNNVLETSTHFLTLENKKEINTEETEVEEPVPVKTEKSVVQNSKFKITHYCACSKCCGIYASEKYRPNGKVLTASGKEAVPMYTVAADTSIYPFGTILEINGNKYEVMDTGSAVKGNVIDVYVGDSSDAHKKALKLGCYYTTDVKKVIN